MVVVVVDLVVVVCLSCLAKEALDAPVIRSLT